MKTSMLISVCTIPELPAMSSPCITGQFLGNHYRAALDTIFALEHELQILKENISLTEDDFHENIRHEMQYLEGLKKQSPIASRKIQYIQALQGLEQAE